MGVGQIIFEEIAKAGPISFARFMELALYCPECGYYEKEADTIGRRGDFYTSVSVGSLFGELLAFDFARRRDRLAERGPLQWVEAGAHDGRLARDLLGWWRQHRPDLFAQIEYIILESSARRRTWQEQTLKEFAGKVRWLPGLLPAAERFVGVLFANELLDAFPVRRLAWDAGKQRWFEWGVTARGNELDWVRLELPPREAGTVAQWLNCPAELAARLPDGFTTEVGAAANLWWRQAAAVLERGWLITLDYGLTDPEVFQAQRAEGSVRAYHRHRTVANVLAQPGEQDLTAHVNFSRLQTGGEASGLQTEFFGSQGQFLTAIASTAWNPTSGFGGWDSRRTRQFQTLTHPEFLGRAFRGLVQSRRVNNP